MCQSVPHPSYNNGLDYSDLLERDLDEEFSGREYLLDAYDDLAAREPSFFGSVGNFLLAFSCTICIANPLIPIIYSKGAEKVAEKGVHIAEKVAENPIVQTAASLVPGGGEVVAGVSVFPFYVQIY